MKSGLSRLFLLLAIVALFFPVVFACVCPTGQHEVNGKCVVKPVPQPVPPPTPTPNSNSTSNSTSVASSNSTSAASSVSTSNATGGNASATGGNATSVAQGGAGGAGGSVKNSGNSSNTNTNTANGGQGGSASQSSTNTNASSATNNGNNSNNSVTNIAAPKIPVNTAYAPSTYPTVTCFKGLGAGVQTGAFGGSFGGGKIDENCAILEAASKAQNRLSYCKVYISNKYVKKAGVTLEDCMAEEPKPEAAPISPAPAPVQIILPSNTPIAAVAPPQVVAPPEYKTEITVEPNRLIGICTFTKAISCQGETGPSVVTVSAVCRQMLDAAREALRRNPGSVLIIRGNHNPSEDRLVATSRANNVKRQLEANGVKSSQIKVEAGTGSARTVEIVLAQN